MEIRRQSDDEIIAEERRLYRQRIFVGLLLTLGLLLLVFALVYAGQVGWLPTWGDTLASAAATYYPLTLLAVLLFVLWRFRKPKAARSSRILRRQIDTYRRREYIAFVAFVFAAAMMANLHGGHPVSPILALLLAAFAATLSWIACFGIGYPAIVVDERQRALRARAAQLGYFTLILLLGGYFVFDTMRPSLAHAALPWFLMTAAVLPIVFLIILEASAPSGED